MNRRGFLTALVGAPLAAIVAPVAAKPAYAVGGFIRPQSGYIVGEAAVGESIFPLSAVELSANPARVMQSICNEAYGATDESESTFEEMAAYCDEIVTIEVDCTTTAEQARLIGQRNHGHTSPAAFGSHRQTYP